MVYYSSVTLFTHVHVEDNTVFLHSHPFKKTSDDASHHHSTSAEIQLIHDLSTILTDQAFIVYYDLSINRPVLALTRTLPVPEYIEPEYCLRSLRAPPLF